MKQSKKPLQSLLLLSTITFPLIASASTAGLFAADALLSDGNGTAIFDWPRFSLLAAGVIALVRARASITPNDDIDGASKSGNTF